MDGQTAILIDNAGFVHKLQGGSPSPIASCVILSILFLLGFTFNFTLLVSIILNKELRNVVFNIIIVFITITCLLDCVINETTAFVFLLSWRWIASTWWCESSAATFLFILIIQTSGICLLCLERYLALKEKYLDMKETFTCIVSCWIFGIVSVIPIWVGNSPVNYFPSRNVCGVIQGNENTSIWTLLFGFIIPWLTMSVLVTACFIKFYKKLRAIQDVPVLSSLQGSASRLQMPTMEEKHYKVTLKILIFYCILMLPHALIVMVSQITTPYFYPNHWENPKNTTTSFIKLVETGSHDDIFTWSRYQYNIITPVIVFITYKDIRKHCKLLFFLRQQQNSVNNLESKPLSHVRNNFVGTSHGSAPDVISHMLTPVLFASSNGLHLRTIRSEKEEEIETKRKSSNSNPPFGVNVCDLTIEDVKIPTVKNASVVVPFDESEEVEIQPKGEGCGKKNVRFASVVNEIPLLESGVFGSPDETTDEASRTHTVELPVFVKVKAEINSSNDTFIKNSEM